MYTILNMGYTPSQWVNLNPKEKIFIMACIDLKIEEEKKTLAKAKSKAHNKKGRR